MLIEDGFESHLIRSATGLLVPILSSPGHPFGYVSLLNHRPTYLLTPWSRVLLEKLTGSPASQEIPRIFGTRKFLTVFTSARQLSLSWANSIQSPQPPSTPWRSILMLPSHLRLGLPNGLFHSGFPTRTPCQFLFLCQFDQIPIHGLPLWSFTFTLKGHTMLNRTHLDKWSARCRTSA